MVLEAAKERCGGEWKVHLESVLLEVRLGDAERAER